MPKNKQSNISLPTDSPARRRRPFSHHPLFIVIIIIVVAVGAFFAIRHFTSDSPKGVSTLPAATSSVSAPTSTPSSPSSPTTPADTSSSTESSTSSSVSPDGKTPEQYDGADPNLDASLTGSITTAHFSGDTLIVRVTIDQYLSSGTCTLTLSSNGMTLEKSAPIAPIAATSSCEGFDISGAELSGFTRPISLSLTFTSGNKTGTTTGVTE